MIRTCGHCGQKNRQRAAQMHLTMRCAACKQPFEPIAEPIEADAELFADVQAHAQLPVLVDFWAEWCGPCHMAAPEVAKAARQLAGRAIVLKVNSDRHAEIASRFGVRGIPNFVVLRNGQPVFQQAGVVPHTELVRWLQSAAAGTPIGFAGHS